MKFKINIIILLLLCTSYIYGQRAIDSSVVQLQERLHGFDSSLATLQLDTLQGKIKAIYSKNYRLRAELIQTMVEKCCKFYEQKFPEIKFTAQLLILDTNDFSNVLFPFTTKTTYGMPFCILKRNSIVMGADKKAVSEQLGSDNTPTPDSILSWFDGIALHELGHVFFGVVKNIHPKENWASEFIANYFAECYYAETIPGFFKDIDSPAQNNAPKYQPKYKTLEDFEQLYVQVGARNYGWYQGKFNDLCDRLYPKFKIELIRKIIANYSANGENLDMLILLKQITPEITNKWLEEMK
jgi:hypothetical protein